MSPSCRKLLAAKWAINSWQFTFGYLKVPHFENGIWLGEGTKFLAARRKG